MGVMVESLVAQPARTYLPRDFGAWMTSEQRRIYCLCQRFLQDRDEADSATQDTFLKAYQALDHEGGRQDVRDIEDPARWLTRIAVNTCLDRLRSRKWQFWRRRPSPADESAILAMTPSAAPEAEQRALSNEIGVRIEKALEKLSTRQRTVFTLRHYEDMSLEEIGHVLGVDSGTVKAHMFRAVSKMREELRDLYGGSL